MVHRWIMGMALGAISLVLAVGCGGGDSTTTVTKAEFTTQANSICADGEKEREEAFADYPKRVKAVANGGGGAKAEREVANEIIDESILPSMQDQLGQMEELDVPEGDEAAISKMLNNLSKSISEVEADGVVSVVEGNEFTTFKREAKAYGLKDCA